MRDFVHYWNHVLRSANRFIPLNETEKVMMVVNENKIKEEKGAGVSLMSKLDRKALSSRAWWRLIHDLNCAQATLITMQEYLEEVENPPAYLVTGLEGGVVGSGSTCGVVTCGALALGLKHVNSLASKNPAFLSAFHEKVRKYVDLFQSEFGSSLCRERTDVDFTRPFGLIRYFFPGDRLLRCFHHIGKSAKTLADIMDEDISVSGLNKEVDEDVCLHCAQSVLERFRKETGLGNERLETMALALDGGVGLTGGVCGALVGAIMALNTVWGIDVSHLSYGEILKAFLVGHVDIWREEFLPRGTYLKVEPYAVGNSLIRNFVTRFGSNECSVITGKRFEDYTDFKNHINHSKRCFEIVEASSRMAIEMVEKNR